MSLASTAKRPWRGSGLGGQNEVLGGPRSGAPGQPVLDEARPRAPWGECATPMTNLGGLCLELLSGKGLESAFLEGIGLKHKTVLCHHGEVFPKPPWKQGQSHGCTDFGFLLAGIFQTGTTASQAF